MQVLNGFVKIHRKMLQWGWYQDSDVKSVFLHLLLTASYKETEWMGKKIHKGQVVVGTEKMAAELGLTRQTVRTAISKLKSTNEITTESTNKFTIVTLVNWEEYQILSESPTSNLTSESTNEQPAEVMNKLLTNLESLKKSTSKSTSRNELLSLMNSGFEEPEGILLTSKLTNEQPTTNQQLTNKQPHLKNIKNNIIYNPPVGPPTERHGVNNKLLSVVNDSALSDEAKSIMTEWLQYKEFKLKPVNILKLIDKTEKALKNYSLQEIREIFDYSISNGYPGVYWDRLQRNRTAKSDKAELSAESSAAYDKEVYQRMLDSDYE